jgi:hypothetical protein
MHTLGKVFSGFVFVAAVAGLVLMSRQLQVKNSYTKKLRDLKKQNINDARSIEAKQAELASLDAEYQRVMHEQLSYWDKRSGLPNPPQRPADTIGMQVGTQDGVGVPATNPQAPGKAPRQRTRLHVFYQPKPNNPQTYYVGPFEVGDKPGELGANNSVLYPGWGLRRNEIRLDNPANWPRGISVYRIRATVPTRYTTGFRDLYLKLEDVARDIASANADEKQAADQLKAAEAEVTQYRVIIAGNAGNAGNGGMLAELSKAEDERDAVLGVVDRLRRELKIEVDTRGELIKQNKDLLKKLPQPASESGKR